MMHKLMEAVVGGPAGPPATRDCTRLGAPANDLLRPRESHKPKPPFLHMYLMYVHTQGLISNHRHIYIYIILSISNNIYLYLYLYIYIYIMHALSSCPEVVSDLYTFKTNCENNSCIYIYIYIYIQDPVQPTEWQR